MVLEFYQIIILLNKNAHFVHLTSAVFLTDTAGGALAE